MNTSRAATSGQGAQVIAAVAAAIDAHPLTGRGRESLHHLRRDGLRPFGIGLGLVAERAQALDAVFQRRVIQIGHTGLYSVVEPF